MDLEESYHWATIYILRPATASHVGVRRIITGLLFPLLLVFVLAISQVGILNVYAESLAESLSKYEKISVVVIVLANALVAAGALFYFVNCKNFSQAFNIIAISLTPVIVYNSIVVLYRSSLPVAYVPLDPLGLFGLLFINELTVTFLALHLSVWTPTYLIYGLMLKKSIPSIGLRNIILSALGVIIFYIIVAIPISYLITTVVLSIAGVWGL